MNNGVGGNFFSVMQFKVNVMTSAENKKSLKQSALGFNHLLGELNPCCRDENPMS